MTKTRWGVLVVALFTAFTILEGVVAPLAGQDGTGTLQGSIFDGNWAPVVGARVLVEGTALRAVADSSGGFRIEGVPVGTIAIRVSYVGFKPRQLTDIAIVAGKTTVQDISLVQTPSSIQQIEVAFDGAPTKPATGTIVGQVMDPSGLTIPNARVLVIGSALAALADPNGRYRITGVPAGVVSLRISYVGYKPRFHDSITVVAGGVVVQDVKLENTAVQGTEGMVAPRPRQDPIKPASPRRASKQDEARRRLMRELYQIAMAPLPLRAGRAGLLFDRLRAEDDARRIAELERLRPRRTAPRVPILIATHGELNSGRPGS